LRLSDNAEGRIKIYRR